MDDISLLQATEEVINLATSFAGSYVDFVENVPFHLQRNISQLREIDCKCRETLTEIESLYANFIKEKDPALKRRNTLMQIQRMFCRCQELGDEKIAIVQQMTETIENRKRLVEHSGFRFKSAYRPDLKNEFIEKRELHKSDAHKVAKRSRRHRHHPCVEKHHEKDKVVPMDTTPPVPQSTLCNNGNTNGPVTNSTPNLHLPLENKSTPIDVTTKSKEENTPVKKNEKMEKKDSNPSSSPSVNSVTLTTTVTSSLRNSTLAKTTAATKSSMFNKSVTSGSNSNGSNKTSLKGKKKKKKVVKQNVYRPLTRSPSPHVDIPVDPDEPTYCLCDQVSFGQMIGCDNKKCPIEWFHFSCVSLSYKPKGKWYCPDCTRGMKDRKKESKKRSADNS